jgi:dihydrofolate reductase
MYTTRGTDWAAPGCPVSRHRGVSILDSPDDPGAALIRLEGSSLPAVPADNTTRRRTEMGKIVISTNMSLDGVVQDPDGGEGFSRGGWFVRQGSKDLEEWGKIEAAEALHSAAVLLGRRSDGWFGTRWASRPGEWADRLNTLPKYVVAATLPDPKWTNVTVLTGNVVDAVARLKQQVDGDIVVYASYQLGRALIEHDLVDELRLFVFPVVVGAGERLFGETSSTKAFRLTGSRTVGDGLVFLTYEFARDA